MNLDIRSRIVNTDLEAPIPILFWEPLEFVLAISLMGFGIITDLWILGAAAGIGVLIGARFMKRGSKKGMVQHWLWAIGLRVDKPLSKYFPASWVNEFME